MKKRFSGGKLKTYKVKAVHNVIGNNKGIKFVLFLTLVMFIAVFLKSMMSSPTIYCNTY